MKIVYVYSTMATPGGTERMITEKANYLSERFGYNVTIISCFQLQNENNFFNTSDKIKQINLGIPYFSQYKYKYPKRLWIKWKMNRLLKKSIIGAIKQVDPDIIIGYLVSKLIILALLNAEPKRLLNATRSDTTQYMMQVKSILCKNLSQWIPILLFSYNRAKRRCNYNFNKRRQTVMEAGEACRGYSQFLDHTYKQNQ